MQWLLDNWIWVLFGVGMIVLHLFGHGRHGGGRSRDSGTSQTAPPSATQKPVDGEEP